MKAVKGYTKNDYIAIGFSLKMEVLFLNTTEKDTTKQL